MQIILPPLEIPIDSQFFNQKSEGVVEHGHICSHRFWFKIKTWVDIVKGRIDICAYNIEVSLESLLDRTDEHVEYLRYLDQSPILSKKEMMTLDLAPQKLKTLVMGSAFIY